MKIAKETLNALKNMPIITLNTIHDLLEVKQHINNYQRNTNKKYGLNLEKDEVINREVADMIIINTLGKLNMLPEQSYFLRLVRNTEANSRFSEQGRQGWFFNRVKWLLDTYKGE